MTRPSAKRPLIIVSGALANKPGNGGNAWSRVSWTRGFQRLGCDVLFVEQITRDDCFDRDGNPSEFENSTALAYFRTVMRQFGLAANSALIYEGGEKVDGLPLADLAECAKESKLLFNLSGHLTQPELAVNAPR